MNNRRKGKQIMVVDDESDLILFYRMSLEYYGFEVETFNDPRKAPQVSFTTRNFEQKNTVH